VTTDGNDGLDVGLDMDFLDPNEAPGVATPVRGGATSREGHTAMEVVSRAADEELERRYTRVEYRRIPASP